MAPKSLMQAGSSRMSRRHLRPGVRTAVRLPLPLLRGGGQSLPPDLPWAEGLGRPTTTVPPSLPAPRSSQWNRNHSPGEAS